MPASFAWALQWSKKSTPVGHELLFRWICVCVFPRFHGAISFMESCHGVQGAPNLKMTCLQEDLTTAEALKPIALCVMLLCFIPLGCTDCVKGIASFHKFSLPSCKLHQTTTRKSALLAQERRCKTGKQKHDRGSARALKPKLKLPKANIWKCPVSGRVSRSAQGPKGVPACAQT